MSDELVGRTGQRGIVPSGELAGGTDQVGVFPVVDLRGGTGQVGVFGPEAAGDPTLVLTLDTTAPELSFGAVGGTNAGELLQIQYVSSEPVASGELILADGRQLPLTIGAEELSVLLPADAADGWASLRARDDVGNAADYPALVLITGVPYVPPVTPPRRGGAVVRDRRDRLLVRTRSSCGATSVSSVSRRRRVASPAYSRSRSRADAELLARVWVRPSSRVTLRTRRSVSVLAPVSGRGTLTRRRGDPPPETLIALDLL